MIGRIIKSTGSWYSVILEDNTEISCRVVGKLRLDDTKMTNPIAVGDYVELTLETPTQGNITEVKKRKNYFIRQSPKSKHQVHVVASNIDQAILITTIVEPNIKMGFIDRFLLTTESRDIPTVIVLNKSDLYKPQDMELAIILKSLYERINYTVLIVSAKTGEHLDSLAQLLQNKTSLLAGQSGVGKSSLITAIDPLLQLKTGDISEFSGKGTHTTTFAEMHPLSFGGHIIDTPGIKTLTYNYFEIEDVAHNFREFFTYSSDCKFGANCMHRKEPQCAVKTAVETGAINPIRYQNYLGICEEIESQNYWERLDY